MSDALLTPLAPPAAPPQPIEVALATGVKACRTCNWFWKGIKPYGPYPSYDWTTDYPPEVVRTEKQSSGNLGPQPWLAAKVIGSGFQDPGIMHGCRKAPIMTIGINPNMTAWFPYSSSAGWIYPGFESAARYAFYYRHFTLYQESLSGDYLRSHLSTAPQDLLVAEADGYVVSSSRENTHNYLDLVVQYDGHPATTGYDIAWAPEERWVVLQNSGTAGERQSWFRKGDILAGRFDPATEGTAEIYENAAGYYQRMLPVLDLFKRKVGLEAANLTIGEDVAQHDMVACASPGWQSKFDMPMDRIAANCVSDHGWMVQQFVQSQPALVILVSTSALAMFRAVFAPFMTLNADGDVYQLMRETCARPTYVTIDLGPVNFRTRLIVSPHFSYADGFSSGARISDAAWKAFAGDYRDDAQAILQAKAITPIPDHNTPSPYLVALTPELRSRLSISAQAVLDGYGADPFDLIAGAIADEYKAGTITFDPATGHLARGRGPCRFCVNDLWQFPEGCPYGKPDEAPLPVGELEAAVQEILRRAKAARMPAAPPTPTVLPPAGVAPTAPPPVMEI